MKPPLWLLLGTVLGVILSAAAAWVAAPRRGDVIELLPTPTPAPIVVYVSGAVQHPGVYSLAPGSRVLDAVEAAGGLLTEADSKSCNLAGRLKDGDQVNVMTVRAQPTQGEPAAGLSPGPIPEASGTAEPELPIDLNSATLEELQFLPGIGLTRAEAIVTYRRETGGFQSIEEIQNVPGIGPSTFEKLKDMITVE